MEELNLIFDNIRNSIAHLKNLDVKDNANPR